MSEMGWTYDYARERHDAEAHSTYEPETPDRDELEEMRVWHTAEVERARRAAYDEERA